MDSDAIASTCGGEFMLMRAHTPAASVRACVPPS